MEPFRKVSERVQLLRVVSAESDLLDLLPSEWRPLAKPFIPFILKIAERGAANAIAHALNVGSATALMTVKEAADCLSVSPSEVRNLIAQGELEAVKHRRLVRIVRASLEAFIERHKHKRSHQ